MNMSCQSYNMLLQQEKPIFMGFLFYGISAFACLAI
jgi:hypothetical protein